MVANTDGRSAETACCFTIVRIMLRASNHHTQVSAIAAKRVSHMHGSHVSVIWANESPQQWCMMSQWCSYSNTCISKAWPWWYTVLRRHVNNKRSHPVGNDVLKDVTLKSMAALSKLSLQHNHCTVLLSFLFIPYTFVKPQKIMYNLPWICNNNTVITLRIHTLFAMPWFPILLPSHTWWDMVW